MKFGYGEALKIIRSAPEKYLVYGEIGSVCGVDQIKSQRRTNEFDMPNGSIVYLIEAPCGNAVEVPEKYLVAMFL